MSDLEDKVIQKGGDFGENFSDLIKKVVEQELGGGDSTPVQQETPATAQEEAAVKEEFIMEDRFAEPEQTVTKEPQPVVFEWAQETKPVVESYQPVSEVGVISATTSINGTVSTKGHVRIEGGVIGDIFAFGDVKVNGKVAGDIDGENVELEDCRIDGDIKARGDINVGKESLVNGNVNGQLITIDGKINGDIEAVKGAHMSGSSSVKGSIASPTLSMSTGAELQGRVNVAKDNNF